MKAFRNLAEFLGTPYYYGLPQYKTTEGQGLLIRVELMGSWINHKGTCDLAIMREHYPREGRCYPWTDYIQRPDALVIGITR